MARRPTVRLEVRRDVERLPDDGRFERFRTVGPAYVRIEVRDDAAMRHEVTTVNLPEGATWLP